jgi:hypothetical protein
LITTFGIAFYQSNLSTLPPLQPPIKRALREEGAGKSYEQELREQMEYKRALEDERRRREREDEERMERRTRDRVHTKNPRNFFQEN